MSPIQAIREHSWRRLVKRGWPYLTVTLAAFAIVGWCQNTSENAADASHEAKQTALQVKVLADKNVELTRENRRLVISLENSIIGACKKNGNALREVIREEIREGITDPNDPSLRELFPGVSPQRIEELVHESNMKKHTRLEKAQNVDCKEVYRQYQGQSLPGRSAGNPSE